MKFYNRNYLVSALVLTLSITLCNNELQLARADSGSLVGSEAGVYGGPPGTSVGASAGALQFGSGSGGVSGSAAAATGGSSSSSGGLSVSGAVSSADSSSSNNNYNSNNSGSSQASSTAVSVTSTGKQEGIFSKVKDILKESKEILTGDKKVETSVSVANAASSGGSSSTNLSVGGSSSASSSQSSVSSSSAQSSSSSSAVASVSVGSTSRPDSFMPKQAYYGDDQQYSMRSNVQSGESRDSSFMDKVESTVSRGSEVVKDIGHKIEDKAHDMKERMGKVMDENVVKPMQSTSGSGERSSEGKATIHAQLQDRLKGSEKEKYLNEMRSRQEAEIPRPSKLKDVVAEAKSRGVIPLNEDRSALKGNHADERSVAVEVFDKAHEMSKIPVEKVLRPIDKILGYEKDPLLRIYDNTHEIIRKPLGFVSKPVESIFNGAFRTSDEAKRDQERLLSTSSEQERQEARLKEEIKRKEDRSVVGSIADKSLELATKPIEIVLRPIDHLFGFKKNPFLRALDEFYGLSKKPVDAVAKPFESILRKMGEDDQMYQVSIRFQNEKDNSDPKLITRLADGALNIADRVLTKPLEIVLKPLDHALGFDDPGKKNPILEAAHSLKNATKVGVELFTRPVDRIIKEIADIGGARTEAEREALCEHQREIASRLVHIMDKFKDVAQLPFEIILRPVGIVLGTNKDGGKDPILRAWDVVHQVIRTPFQVISKPIEDSILGEPHRRHRMSKGGAQGSSQSSAQARVQVNGNNVAAKAGAVSVNVNAGGRAQREDKKNIIVDSIKKVEKLAIKPLEIITSPIRKMILGEDNDKMGTLVDKNNREVQAKVRGRWGYNQERQPDKIMATLEKVNNVALQPLSYISQPISDIILKGERIIEGTRSSPQVQVKAQAQSQSSAYSSRDGSTKTQASSRSEISNKSRENSSSVVAKAEVKKSS